MKWIRDWQVTVDGDITVTFIDGSGASFPGALRDGVDQLAFLRELDAHIDEVGGIDAYFVGEEARWGRDADAS